MATHTELALMEKIVRAKVALEGGYVSHNNCPAEDITGHIPECRCGADKHNARIANALRELDLSK